MKEQSASLNQARYILIFILILLASCEKLKYNEIYIDKEEGRYKQYHKLYDGYEKKYDYSIVDY